MRIQRLQALMAAGRAAEDAGDYAAALQQYDAVVQQFPDFATTEYARLARALMLYQLGRVSDAILQLQVCECGCACACAPIAVALLDWAERLQAQPSLAPCPCLPARSRRHTGGSCRTGGDPGLLLPPHPLAAAAALVCPCSD